MNISQAMFKACQLSEEHHTYAVPFQDNKFFGEQPVTYNAVLLEDFTGENWQVLLTCYYDGDAIDSDLLFAE